MYRLILALHSVLLSVTVTLNANAQTEYRIGPEDVLKIYVYEEPDLTLEVRVSPDGRISYPLLGRVEVGGMSAREIELLLTELLEKDYLVNPQVNVSIQEYSKVYVVGEVKQSGPIPMKPGLTVMTALAMAGGVGGEASSGKIRVIRDREEGAKEAIEVDLADIIEKGLKEKDIPLQPGDVVQVLEIAGRNVYILGQVMRPGEYAIKEGLTVVEAISLAGGLTKVASANGVRVIRIEDGIKKIIKVPVGKILSKGDKKRDVVLEPDDVIMVPESFF